MYHSESSREDVDDVLGTAGRAPEVLQAGVEVLAPETLKLHLDVHTDDDLDAEVARWIEAGATSLGKRSAGDFSWVTLTDPDGNQFCIAGG